MDPPQLPPHPTTIPNSTTTTTPPLPNYPNSSDSSPRSHATWDDPHQAVPGAKLRLMCSHGGHIIPRPHDKSLCYVGGDTRMVVVDRLSSLIDLSSRLSRTLLHGRHFNLKYQLPNEDLDSLVSVSTDEDLENMIEEYDRIASVSPAKTSRLRLFLFLAKPETAASMGSLLNDAKSETWFVDALNGTGLDIPRVLSDSAAINNLLQFDDQIVHNNKNNDHFTDLEAQNEHSHILTENKILKNTPIAQEVLQSSMLDSPMVEKNSSFGSSSSSPTMSNLPPIRVRAETNNVAKLQDQMAGLDEQFLHMNTNVQNQGDGRGAICVPPPMSVVSSTSVCCASHNNNRLVSDDERSDQGAPSGFRKPPLPLQIVPRRHGHDDAYNNLPSPDSAASDSSIASANSLSKNAHNYPDPTHVPTRDQNTKPPSSAVLLNPNPNPNNTISDQQNPQIPTHQIQEQVYIQNPQQQQYYHPGTHYIQHATTNAVPVQSYYQMYAPTAQSPYHQQLDQQQQQYSMYLMPVTQTQPYKINNVQSNNATDISNVSASIYQQNLQNQQPVINAPPSAAKPPQFQQQYVIPHPSSQSPGPATGNYGYEYATHQAHEQQVYYTQHAAAANQLPPPPPPQYQTITSAAAVMLSQPSAAQQAVDNGQQQMR